MDKLYRVGAFSLGNIGGNPAGVMVNEVFKSDDQMKKIAHEVGYSETAFLHPVEDGFRIRYFAPEIEIPFCGHATIGTGRILGDLYGSGTYKLYLNSGDISVSVADELDGIRKVSLISPNTKSSDMNPSEMNKVLELFNLSNQDLDSRFPMKYAFAGALHIIVFLKTRKKLSEMNYPFQETKEFMIEKGLATISLLWFESNQVIHSRNAFASGGVVEDPATGAAAAALAGYLRDISWGGPNQFEIIQGVDMGIPSKIQVSYSSEISSGITLTGETRIIEL